MKKSKMTRIFHFCKDKVSEIALVITYDHVGAYAAQSAYFLVLSIIPFLLLLLTIVRYTVFTKLDILEMIIPIFPNTIDPLIRMIVNQVYAGSSAVIPITAVVALWSAGRGVVAMASGLNCIYDCVETRNYIFVRVRAMVYTLLMIAIIMFVLVSLVFGNSLAAFIVRHFPFMKKVVERLIGIRVVTSLGSLFVFSMLVYHFLPNQKRRIKYQIAGSIFTSVGWLLVSFVFSIYLDVFRGFSSMYGSMTTIILLMLWFYFIMYVMLLGGVVNIYCEKIARERKEKKRKISKQ